MATCPTCCDCMAFCSFQTSLSFRVFLRFALPRVLLLKGWVFGLALSPGQMLNCFIYLLLLRGRHSGLRADGTRLAVSGCHRKRSTSSTTSTPPHQSLHNVVLAHRRNRHI